MTAFTYTATTDAACTAATAVVAVVFGAAVYHRH